MENENTTLLINQKKEQLAKLQLELDKKKNPFKWFLIGNVDKRVLKNALDKEIDNSTLEEIDNAFGTIEKRKGIIFPVHEEKNQTIGYIPMFSINGFQMVLQANDRYTVTSLDFNTIEGSKLTYKEGVALLEEKAKPYLEEVLKKFNESKTETPREETQTEQKNEQEEAKTYNPKNEEGVNTSWDFGNTPKEQDSTDWDFGRKTEEAAEKQLDKVEEKVNENTSQPVQPENTISDEEAKEMIGRALSGSSNEKTEEVIETIPQKETPTTQQEEKIITTSPQTSTDEAIKNLTEKIEEKMGGIEKKEVISEAERQKMIAETLAKLRSNIEETNKINIEKGKLTNKIDLLEKDLKNI